MSKPALLRSAKAKQAVSPASSKRKSSTARALDPAKPNKKSRGKRKPVPIEPVATVEHAKVRIKLVRDSFTMPREDFDRIARLKSRAIDFKRPAKKSELLRAGLQVLERLDDAVLLATLSALQPIKTGRPKKRH